MAGIDGTITFATAEYRPCLVNGRKAIFHRWADKAEIVGESPLLGGHAAGQIWGVFGIVENEDGYIAEVYPSRIKFLDSSRLFNEIEFPPKMEEIERQ